jgi:hypothetical protein
MKGGQTPAIFTGDLFNPAARSVIFPSAGLEQRHHGKGEHG